MNQKINISKIFTDDLCMVLINIPQVAKFFEKKLQNSCKTFYLSLLLPALDKHENTFGVLRYLPLVIISYFANY